MIDPINLCLSMRTPTQKTSRKSLSPIQQQIAHSFTPSQTNLFLRLRRPMWTGVRNKNRVQFPSREKGAKKPELPEIKTIERLFTRELRRSLELTLISGLRHRSYQDNLAYSSLVTFGVIRSPDYFFKIFSFSS